LRRTNRFARQLVTSVLVVGALAAATPASVRVTLPPVRLTDSYDQQIAQLQQQYNALGTQLQGLQGSEAAENAQAAAVQSQIAATQTQVSQAQAQIDQLNVILAQTGEAIQLDTAHLAAEKAQLTRITVAIYTAGGSGVVSGLVDSQSISEFMEKIDSATTVSQKFQQLIAQVQVDEQRLEVLQQQQQAHLAQAAAAESQLEALESQLQGQETELKQEVASLSSQAAGIVSQRQSLLGQIAAVQAEQKAAEEAAAAAAARAAAEAEGGGGGSCGGVLCPFAFGTIPDSFPWGQCTWYVASLREVPWWGNADEWLGNAQSLGYSTGMTPKAGAIVVWGGGNGYSYYGHVAYVVAVVGPTDFFVDEANYNEIPGQLDSREVTTMSDVEGFIY
jgi:peptidoglycan hydrolase CwlO-like protein